VVSGDRPAAENEAVDARQGERPDRLAGVRRLTADLARIAVV